LRIGFQSILTSRGAERLSSSAFSVPATGRAQIETKVPRCAAKVPQIPGAFGASSGGVGVLHVDSKC
jgi:hypothetical protein